MSRSAAEPLRPMSEEERKELQHVGRASSERRIRHQRAVARLSVAQGHSLSEAARLVGWKRHESVTKGTRRFNRLGLCALNDWPRPGPHRTDGPAEHAYHPAYAARSGLYLAEATPVGCHTGRTREIGEGWDGLQSEEP